MDEWNQAEIDLHLANQAALIETAGELRTIGLNALDFAQRDVQGMMALVFLLAVWLGYVIAGHFLPSKRDIAG